MNKLKATLKEYQKSSLLLTTMIGKKQDFPAQQKDQKKFELNSKAIALNILFVPYNTEDIRLAYKSKYNFKRENHVILLMITDGKKWHYLAVKKLSALLRGITSKHVGEIHCLNCFHSYCTEKVCNYHDYCHTEMPNEGKKILKYNHGENSIKAQFIIYADLECLLEKMSTCHNNSKNHQQPK